jgi:AraC-like DNA-binding protein
VLQTVRAVTLANYVEVARFAGLDPYEMLRSARISPQQLADDESRIPARPTLQLLDDSARLSGVADFGLLMAECRTFASLGPISLVLVHMPNVRAMIEAMIRYQSHLNDVAAMAIHDDGQSALVEAMFDPSCCNPQAIEYFVAVCYRALSEVTRERWQPECIHFMHRAPPSIAAHRRLFQCRIEFDAAFDGFSCSSAALDLPNPLADDALASHAERLLDMVPVRGIEAHSIVESARRSIYLLIHSGNATVDRVADNLGLHPRALQRALEKEGWSFGALLNDVRRELAQRYLSGDHHSIATIAHLAGYSHQSAFTRWFASEFGSTPAVWRTDEQQHQHRQEHEEPKLLVELR